MCPLCGADYPGEAGCEEQFHRCLALEFEQPATYGLVHHLTVACYMLQHNRYSHRAWIEAREMLRMFRRAGTHPREMVRRGRARYDDSRRDVSLLQGPRVPGFETILWTRTVADVRLETPDVYRADVERWADAVLADTEAFVRRPEVSAPAAQA